MLKFLRLQSPPQLFKSPAKLNCADDANNMALGTRVRMVLTARWYAGIMAETSGRPTPPKINGPAAWKNGSQTLSVRRRERPPTPMEPYGDTVFRALQQGATLDDSSPILRKQDTELFYLPDGCCAVIPRICKAVFKANVPNHTANKKIGTG